MSVVLGVINKNSIVNSPINWILGITILFLVFSLLPIANKLSVGILNLLIKNEKLEKHNIFYYMDIYKLTLDGFQKILQEEYGLGYFNRFEIKLIEQIIVNAQILRAKVFWHTFAYVTFFCGLILYGIITIIPLIFKMTV